MIKSIRVGTLLLALLVGISAGCGVLEKKRDEGTLIGAATGALIGGAIGSKSGNTAVGAILGAVIGGAAGAYIGNYMDKQIAEIERDIEGAQVEKVGEGIKITFQSGLLFEVNKSDLNAKSEAELAKLALILNKYADTEILVEGHTDSTGTHDYNLDLSLRRSQTVSNRLTGESVNPTRLTIMGYGPDQPLSSNETFRGRAENRRVEIAIFANGKLKKVAEDKTSN